MPSVKRKGTERLIVQELKIRRKGRRPRQISHRLSVHKLVLHREMDQTLAQRHSLSLSLLILLVTQEILSGCQIQELPIMCVPTGIGFLVLRN